MLMRLGTRVDSKFSKKFGYALMLRAINNDTYSRVGIATVPSTEDWWEKGWHLTQLTLV